MYSLCKHLLLRLMKSPTEPPDPPAGSHDSVKIFRASPGYLTYSLISLVLASCASYLIPLMLVIIGMANGEAPPVVIGVLLIPLFAVIQLCLYFGIRLDYDMRYYIVTDRSLRVREGAMIVKEKTISYANVQNMRVIQGPLLRVFGIWHLKIDTAGGGSSMEKGQPGAGAHQVQMAGIENAHEVRDLILGHLRARGIGSGLGDADDLDHSQPRSLFAGAAVRATLQELREATASLRATVEGRLG